MDKNLLKNSFIYSLSAVIYILLVSQIMNQGEKWFGKNESLAPFAVLLLFTLSAAVVGGLILGPTVIFFLENKKSESIKSAIYSVAWLGLFTLLSLLTLFLFS